MLWYPVLGGGILIVSIILCVALLITLVILTINQEQKLLQTFEESDLLWDKETVIKHSDDFIETFDLKLLNLGFLPSYRGEYQSFSFKNRFQLKRYTNFDVLTLHTFMASYSIKLPKSAISMKHDIFTGKLLKIKVKGQNLLFRLPNEMQNAIYKRY